MTTLSFNEICESVPTITSFYDIPIETKTLIICDIDDTVLHFPRRPADMAKIYNDLLNEMGSEEEAQRELDTISNWYFCVKTPEHTDQDGFRYLLNRVHEREGALVFLTARHEKDHSFTCDQLEKIGIDTKSHKIMYTNNEISKGLFIRDSFLHRHGINIGFWSNIIFIDDRDDYIVSVKRFCPHIHCYRFVIPETNK